jgi:hypothetical protein
LLCFFFFIKAGCKVKSTENTHTHTHARAHTQTLSSVIGLFLINYYLLLIHFLVTIKYWQALPVTTRVERVGVCSILHQKPHSLCSVISAQRWTKKHSERNKAKVYVTAYYTWEPTHLWWEHRRTHYGLPVNLHLILHKQWWATKQSDRNKAKVCVTMRTSHENWHTCEITGAHLTDYPFTYILICSVRIRRSKMSGSLSLKWNPLFTNLEQKKTNKKHIIR